MNDSANKGLTALFKSGGALTLVAIIGSALLAGVYLLTADRIEQQERRVILEQLGQIIPQQYDNAILDDVIHFQDEAYFPGGQTVTAWRVRQQNKAVSLVLRFAAMKGYNGRIELLAGINHDGSLRGVRVISHKETPGLGDGIELRKSDWILQFGGQSIGAPPLEDWAVKRDGGNFDQFTGATITPRAIVEAVRLALEYFETHREPLFEAAAESTEVTL